ncbi:unnamed protein product [Trichogramma brassicae]|uniref:Uncharacterized protein n=1 Tax=Trichogramma brassicae TaxID=86971 RepID=A0A6H5JBP2_9HYME|nr:unnamed protein product [Trichogramma brassicae]
MFHRCGYEANYLQYTEIEKPKIDVKKGWSEDSRGTGTARVLLRRREQPVQSTHEKLLARRRPPSDGPGPKLDGTLLCFRWCSGRFVRSATSFHSITTAIGRRTIDRIIVQRGRINEITLRERARIFRIILHQTLIYTHVTRRVHILPSPPPPPLRRARQLPVSVAVDVAKVLEYQSKSRAQSALSRARPAQVLAPGNDGRGNFQRAEGGTLAQPGGQVSTARGLEFFKRYFRMRKGLESSRGV